ncbi:MAG: septum formation initiator family protein [Chloroflexales bacterium]|nr:septum formation initiator family protein [Chloroflexales bacterium]
MKRRTRHATRSLFGLLPRRRPAAARLSVEQVLGALRLSGTSALTIGLAALMLIFIGLLVANFVGQVLQSARLEGQRAALESEVAQMQATNTRLEGAVSYTESDVYVEEVAREQLGYARDGDVVILPRLVAPTPALAPASALPDKPPPPAPTTPNWLRWWRTFTPSQG